MALVWVSRMALVWVLMSALGQKQTLKCSGLMSALPSKADIGVVSSDVRFVPKADILRCDVTDIIGGDIENKEDG